MLFWIVGLMGLALVVVSLIFDDLLDSFDLGTDWISGTAIGGFLGAFGFVGGLTLMSTDSMTTATLAGVGAGAVVGGAAAALTRTLTRKSGGAEFTPADYVGLTGTVVTPIRQDAAGEVTVHVSGQPVKVNARSRSVINQGTRVIVTEALSATSVTVEPVNPA